MDVFGNDITCTPLGTSSPGDVAKLCQSTSGCVAFNIFLATDGAIKYCLKNARSPLSDLSTTYMKGTCQGFYTGAQCGAAQQGLAQKQLRSPGFGSLPVCLFLPLP